MVQNKSVLAILSAACLMNSFASDRLLAKIDADFWDASQAIYLNEIHGEEKGGGPAFNWGVGVMLTALNAAAANSEPAKKRLIEYLPQVKSYWNSIGPVPGFDVLPCPKPVDRYYDDNAWMVLALFDSAKVTGQADLNELALKALDYSLSGWAEERGGGIYWRESDKAGRNTCACSPTAVSAFVAYKVTGQARYKDWGIKILDWTLKNLQDPQDGLMWDNLNNDGKVEKTKWSYNTALTIKAMIQAEDLGWKGPMSGRDLFKRAWAHWFDPAVGVKDAGRFSHLLVDVGLDYDLITLEEKKTLVRLLLGLKDETGRYGDRWDRIEKAPKKHEMIDQASVLRTLARLQSG